MRSFTSINLGDIPYFAGGSNAECEEDNQDSGYAAFHAMSGVAVT